MVNEKNAPNTQCAGSKLPALLSHEISRLPVLPALAPRPPRTRTAAMSAPPARPCAATSDQRLHSARVAARNPDILQMPNYRALTHTCVGRVVTSLGSQVRKLRPRKAKRLDQVAQLARGRARLHASATGCRGTAAGAPTPGSRLRRSRLSPSGTCSPRRPRVRLCPICPHRASRALVPRNRPLSQRDEMQPAAAAPAPPRLAGPRPPGSLPGGPSGCSSSRPRGCVSPWKLERCSQRRGYRVLLHGNPSSGGRSLHAARTCRTSWVRNCK